MIHLVVGIFGDVRINLAVFLHKENADRAVERLWEEFKGHQEQHREWLKANRQPPIISIEEDLQDWGSWHALQMEFLAGLDKTRSPMIQRANRPYADFTQDLTRNSCAFKVEGVQWGI